jgi:hypothetical protein
VSGCDSGGEREEISRRSDVDCFSAVLNREFCAIVSCQVTVMKRNGGMSITHHFEFATPMLRYM